MTPGDKSPNQLQINVANIFAMQQIISLARAGEPNVCSEWEGKKRMKYICVHIYVCVCVSMKLCTIYFISYTI